MSTSAMYCRTCGKALSEEERAIPNTIYCADCAPAAAAAQPSAEPPPPPRPQSPLHYTPPPGPANNSGVSPGLAFLLGLLPGVGAIYNAQYAKGLIHVFIFGLMISIANIEGGNSDLQPIFVMMTMGFYIYMPFEAYHTARRRMTGEIVDEFSSILPLRAGTGFPVAPVLLIATGVIFLLHNLEIIRIGQLLRYWPLFLIGLGSYMLWVRLTGADTPPMNHQEARHEQ